MSSKNESESQTDQLSQGGASSSNKVANLQVDTDFGDSPNAISHCVLLPENCN